VKMMYPFAWIAVSNRLIVSGTEYLLGLVFSPESAANPTCGNDTKQMARLTPRILFHPGMETSSWNRNFILIGWGHSGKLL
jgi:hypothetical protein